MKKISLFSMFIFVILTLFGCGKGNVQSSTQEYVPEGSYNLKYIPYVYEEDVEKDVTQKRVFEFQGIKYETEYVRTYKYGYNDMITYCYKGNKKIGDENINCNFQVIKDSDNLYWEMANYTNPISKEECLEKEEIVKIINDYASQYIPIESYECTLTEDEDGFSAEFTKNYGKYKAVRYLNISCNKKGVIERIIKEPIIELEEEYIIKKLEEFDKDKCLELVEKEVEEQTGEKAEDIYEQYLTAVNGELVMRYSIITSKKELVTILATWK